MKDILHAYDVGNFSIDSLQFSWTIVLDKKREKRFSASRVMNTFSTTKFSTFLEKVHSSKSYSLSKSK